MDPINFELEKPFKFAGSNGSEVDCTFIELREPTGRVSHICNAIEGLIKNAMVSTAERFADGGDLAELAEKAASERAAKDEDESLAPGSDYEEQIERGHAMLTMISGSGVDMSKLTLHCKELFKAVGYMGGEKQITVPRLDDMSHRDLRLMMGVYIANFIMDW